MDYGSAVNSFLPLWIFAPLVLVAVIELAITPKPDASRGSRAFEGRADHVQRNDAVRPHL